MWSIGFHLEVGTKQDYNFKRKSKFVIPTDGAKLMMLKSLVDGFVQTDQCKLVQVPIRLIRKKWNSLRVVIGVVSAMESLMIKSANKAQKIDNSIMRVKIIRAYLPCLGFGRSYI